MLGFFIDKNSNKKIPEKTGCNTIWNQTKLIGNLIHTSNYAHKNKETFRNIEKNSQWKKKCLEILQQSGMAPLERGHLSAK